MVRGFERRQPAPTFFRTAADFRRWLAANHATAREVWVGFYKRDSGKPSLTWPEAVDEALCYGWIDGVRKRVDAESYTNRFTPRRTGSVWSAVNTRRAQELLEGGRMRAAGRRAFEARDERKTAVYSFERRKAPALTAPLEARFKANRAAWDFFTAQPPGYQRICVWMVISARQEATRLRRLDILIAHSAAGRRLDPMKPLRMP